MTPAAYELKVVWLIVEQIMVNMMQFQPAICVTTSLTSVTSFGGQLLAHLLGVPPVPTSGLPLCMVGLAMPTTPHWVAWASDALANLVSNLRLGLAHPFAHLFGMAFATKVVAMQILAPFAVTFAGHAFTTATSTQRRGAIILAIRRRLTALVVTVDVMCPAVAARQPVDFLSAATLTMWHRFIGP